MSKMTIMTKTRVQLNCGWIMKIQFFKNQKNDQK